MCGTQCTTESEQTENEWKPIFQHYILLLLLLLEIVSVQTPNEYMRMGKNMWQRKNQIEMRWGKTEFYLWPLKIVSIIRGKRV